MSEKRVEEMGMGKLLTAEEGLVFRVTERLYAH